jgi:hypothetical protein
MRNLEELRAELEIYAYGKPRHKDQLQILGGDPN